MAAMTVSGTPSAAAQRSEAVRVGHGAQHTLAVCCAHQTGRARHRAAWNARADSAEAVGAFFCSWALDRRLTANRSGGPDKGNAGPSGHARRRPTRLSGGFT